MTEQISSLGTHLSRVLSKETETTAIDGSQASQGKWTGKVERIEDSGMNQAALYIRRGQYPSSRAYSLISGV